MGLQEVPPEDKEGFVRARMKAGEYPILESAVIHVSALTNRKTSHELVRHRTASYCQESTRWCDYSKDRFGKTLSFVFPEWYFHSDTLMDTLWDVNPGKNGDGLSVVSSLQDFLDHPRPVTSVRFSEAEDPDIADDPLVYPLDAWFDKVSLYENLFFESRKEFEELPGRITDVVGDFLPNCLSTRISIVRNVVAWRNFFNTRLTVKDPKKIYPGHYLLAYRCWELLSSSFPVFFEDIDPGSIYWLNDDSK